MATTRTVRLSGDGDHCYLDGRMVGLGSLAANSIATALRVAPQSMVVLTPWRDTFGHHSKTTERGRPNRRSIENQLNDHCDGCKTSSLKATVSFLSKACVSKKQLCGQPLGAGPDRTGPRGRGEMTLLKFISI